MAGFDSAMGPLRPKSCDRARSLISLRLDQTLSELESRMLEAHVARCDDCRAFELGARRLTTTIRTQPLVPLGGPIAVRRHRSFPRLARLAAAGSAAAAVVVAGTLLGLSTAGRTLGPNMAPSADESTDNDVRALRRADMLESVPPPKPRFTHVQRSWPDPL
jgi:predicted anti-sigma-YlaC factor YlaD